MNKKERVDVLLVEKGLLSTREKARRSVMAGLVYTDHERIDKPGMKVDRQTPLYLKGEINPFVSRGGLKLQKALEVFPLVMKGKTVLDIGASTGGFTDCALQHGAKHVYAVDVGYNQLDWRLRSDERVHVMERMNFRYAKPTDFIYGIPNIAVCDVSFISLTHIFPGISAILSEDGEACVLIKPQFEAGRQEVGNKGIVKDSSVHRRVIERVLEMSINECLQPVGLDVSPITGTGGNIEFLLYLTKSEVPTMLRSDVIDEKIAAAKALLKD
ncbi:23S rRNA (cytidine1920-2'-O)/16S rRNA (cytidine1409-2'-O)-methyltransferase [Geomicrobium halophilum]|uniref:23S rRNA (Cytidine1920-2'-O)/16S rRNA (Cytidine1409-2'-O)-methyltransferase n=1 Tax=Geomicrobium halophilum TaxID=549000 RepID=A0A841PMI5_9BACL|nr:TlyA family RNA methyltransferase [Geomicrobium halophilum]MBB6448934.1 23S rRNA (cytidine1920-2'-O)/16S rRNA (cytidine1409-2'-O)-methyltransferase [Geomicrobium halophilum]